MGVAQTFGREALSPEADRAAPAAARIVRIQGTTARCCRHPEPAADLEAAAAASR